MIPASVGLLVGLVAIVALLVLDGHEPDELLALEFTDCADWDWPGEFADWDVEGCEWRWPS